MSSKVTINQSKGVRVIGILAIIAGIVFILGGGAAYGLVSNQLRAENITVADDADFLPGKRVQGPLTAYAQAEIINKHALDGSGGKTYAELDREDPARETMMNASFLRASLFTSVVSFGLAILVMGLGVLFILVGWALRRMTAGPAIVVENFDAPVGRHVSGSDADDDADTKTPSSDAEDQTAPATRVPRRAALPTQEQAADSRSLGGAAVAETLSRHARPGPETETPSQPAPVTAPEPAPEAAVEVADARPVEPVATPMETEASADEAAAPAAEADSIPVPPRQSWQSPAERTVGDDEADKPTE